MTLKPTHWMLIGIGGIAAYLIYSSAKSTAAGTTNAPALGGGGGGGVSGGGGGGGGQVLASGTTQGAAAGAGGTAGPGTPSASPYQGTLTSSLLSGGEGVFGNMFSNLTSS